MKRITSIALAATALSFSMPAQAALVSSGLACSATDVSPTASACSGWWVGNLTGGSPTFRADAQEALAQIGFDWTPNILSNTVEILPSLSGNVIDFTPTLGGLTYIGIHKGAAGGGDQATAFFRWDNLAPTDTITLNLGGLSNSTLYLTTFTAVPEPATWMLMIAGIGLAGAALRRRNRQKVQARIKFA